MDRIEVEPTGFGVQVIEGREIARQQEELEGNKRGVQLVMYERQRAFAHGQRFVATLTYTTGWPQERPFTHLLQAADLDALAELLRIWAQRVLPPGAGFPATPQYEPKQRRLKAQLEVLTLSALTAALKQANATVR